MFSSRHPAIFSDLNETVFYSTVFNNNFTKIHRMLAESFHDEAYRQTDRREANSSFRNCFTNAPLNLLFRVVENESINYVKIFNLIPRTPVHPQSIK